MIVAFDNSALSGTYPDFICTYYVQQDNATESRSGWTNLRRQLPSQLVNKNNNWRKNTEEERKLRHPDHAGYKKQDIKNADVNYHTISNTSTTTTNKINEIYLPNLIIPALKEMINIFQTV